MPLKLKPGDEDEEQESPNKRLAELIAERNDVFSRGEKLPINLWSGIRVLRTKLGLEPQNDTALPGDVKLEIPFPEMPKK